MPSVYALGDPRTGDIRYIGIAQDVYKRYAQHLNHPHKNNIKNAWMEEIKASGVVPTLTILESDVDKTMIYKREMYWINYYRRQGAPLTNSVLPSQRSSRIKRPLHEISLEELEYAMSNYPVGTTLTIVGLASILNTTTETVCTLLKTQALKELQPDTSSRNTGSASN